MKTVFDDMEGEGWVYVKERRTKGYHTMMERFKFDGTCIVEHWDVMQDWPADRKNPLTMLDGQVLAGERKAEGPVGCGLVGDSLPSY